MKDDYKLSIALCTYNGEKYLKYQLESFIAQTRQPDEVIICDDCSSDTTPAILTHFQEAAPFTVRVFFNHENLGYVKNFEQAIIKCTGDIIALSDQDDIWLPEKLERMEKHLINNISSGYAFSNAVLIDSGGHETGKQLWDSVPFTGGSFSRFTSDGAFQVKLLINKNPVTGAAMAFQASLRTMLLPIPLHWAHDAWISFASSFLGFSGLPVQEPLIRYRVHCEQTGGLPKGFLKRLKKHLFLKSTDFGMLTEKWEGAYELLTSSDPLPAEKKLFLRNKIAHIRQRAFICSKARHLRLPAIARELVLARYHRFSLGTISALRDLLLPS